MNLYSLDQSARNQDTDAHVPRDEAVFLTYMTGIKILCLKYLGEDGRRMSWLSKAVFKAAGGWRWTRFSLVLSGAETRKSWAAGPGCFAIMSQIRAGGGIRGQKCPGRPCGRLRRKWIVTETAGEWKIGKQGARDKKHQIHKGQVSGIRFRPCPFPVSKIRGQVPPA